MSHRLPQQKGAPKSSPSWKRQIPRLRIDECSLAAAIIEDRGHGIPSVDAAAGQISLSGYRGNKSEKVKGTKDQTVKSGRK